MAELNLNRVEMPKQDPLTRARNFLEVALGYGEAEALAEASRCIQCPRRSCVGGCPVGVTYPIYQGAALRRHGPRRRASLKTRTSCPASAAGLPQETQCEKSCVLAKRGAPIAIGRLERYVCRLGAPPDREGAAAQSATLRQKGGRGGRRPGRGLTFAADLAVMGHEVTIFEALTCPAAC
jgi:glutamate synthase (NADPH/NADH) small chain